MRRNEQGWEYPKVQGYGRGENQAGERVGVAKAPRLGSQQTAEPTAFGSFCDYGQKDNCGSVFRGWCIGSKSEDEKMARLSLFNVGCEMG